MTVYRLLPGAQLHPYNSSVWTVVARVANMRMWRELVPWLEEVDAPAGIYSLDPATWFIRYPEAK
jgi:hypothetical protein